MTITLSGGSLWRRDKLVRALLMLVLLWDQGTADSSFNADAARSGDSTRRPQKHANIVTIPDAHEPLEPSVQSVPTPAWRRELAPVRPLRVVSSRISQSTDDAMEIANGLVRTGLLTDPVGFLNTSPHRYTNMLGLRFQNVKVPQGAKITSAHVEFTSNEAEAADEPKLSVVVYGQNSDDPVTFKEGNTIYDITGRRRTVAQVNWNNIDPWTRKYVKNDTPDLRNIVQEIIDRPGWKAGNSMVFLITEGTNGSRFAVAFDEEPANAPLLKVAYESDATESPTATPTTREPTLSPTPLPTEPPTGNPTSAPTREPTALPTIQPTKFPTPEPTPLPTLSPTAIPTEPPTRKPTLAPTIEPTGLPTTPPTILPTPEPTPLPTRQPSPIPTIRSTQPPTPKAPTKPAAINRDSVVELQTGNTCVTNKDCKSRTCRNGVCMASSECYPIKHKKGSPFDVDTINVVFVGSAFEGVSSNEWYAQANATYQVFGNFKMLSRDIDQLNVFVVVPETPEPRFCDFGCQGIDRLLCCDIAKAHALSRKCFPVGANLQTVVVHNEETYGGAGYVHANVATVSTHPSSPVVAVHELGHSLFELGDEYPYGASTDISANCDSSSSCEKWKDLLWKKNTPPGYNTVKCIPGCQGNKFFVAGMSFMQDLSFPMGAVNERFTCCTYQALTKSMPKYCKAFNKSPSYLLNYCKNKDLQSYGSINYDPTPRLAVHSNNATVPNGNYIYLSDPVLVSINLHNKKRRRLPIGKADTTPGLYRRSQVEGDYLSAKAASKDGLTKVVKVMVFYSTGKQVLFFSPKTIVDVPFAPFDETVQDDVPSRIMGDRDVVEFTVDKRGRRLKRIRAKMQIMEAPGSEQ